ncbi:MAG: protein kinase domain-containing protein [Myxococcaceae bacterium]
MARAFIVEMPDASRYERLRVLARGAAAEIFLGRDSQSNADVVLKVLRPELGADSELSQRFLDEARLCQGLEHPNIVRHLSFGRDTDNRLFLVSEYLDGEDLKTYLRGHPPLSPEQLIELMLPICSALESVHMQGVLHRDLKPENVVLVGGLEAYQPKLIDFGNAWSAMNQFRTSPGGVVGTAEYSAPECIRGELGTPRSDLYSLGILMFECLVGAPPFTGPDLGTVWRQHLEDLPPALPDDVGGVELVIRRCLAKDPLARFGTASEVADALKTVRSERLARQTPALPSGSWMLSQPPPDSTPTGIRPRVVARAPAPITAQLPIRRSGEKKREERLRQLRVLGAGAGVGLLLIWAMWPERQPPREPAPPLSVRGRDVFAITPRKPVLPFPDEAPQVRLELSSVPAGASVFRLDTGEQLGVTPLVWKTAQASKEVALRFVLAEHQTVERKLKLSANAFMETALFQEEKQEEGPAGPPPRPTAKRKNRPTVQQNRDALLDPYAN